MNSTSAKRRLRKISTTQKYIIRVQGHILYYTMCRNTAHGRHIIYIYTYMISLELSVCLHISFLFTGICMDVFRLFVKESHIQIQYGCGSYCCCFCCCRLGFSFQILFIMILNATAYGRIFCTFTRYVVVQFFVSPIAVTPVTIDFLLHFVLHSRIYV